MINNIHKQHLIDLGMNLVKGDLSLVPTSVVLGGFRLSPGLFYRFYAGFEVVSCAGMSTKRQF